MRINGNTQIYGIIGYPVKHTYSPAMHNAAFRSLGINAVYVPFEVKPGDLKESLACLRSAGVRGFNVTVPHKENVIKYLDEVDREASLIRAVNTIVNEDGRLKGYNTDGKGFISSLEEDLAVTPKGKRFFILGAGGASRAISFSLALKGARRIVLVDTVREKAIKLAKSLAKIDTCEVIALKRDRLAMKEMLMNTDVLINATPCGMKDTDPRVIEPELLHKRLRVVDVIYNPGATKLLRDAGGKGAAVSNGTGMLLHQGLIAFRLWTGRKPPVEVMRRALKRTLKKRGY